MTNESIANDINNPLIYRGFRVFWTGWKPIQNNESLAGQWLAWPPVGDPIYDRRMYVASVPGELRQYQAGESFDIAAKDGQFPITLHTSKEDAESAMHKGLERIKGILDSVPPYGEGK